MSLDSCWTEGQEDGHIMMPVPTGEEETYKLTTAESDALLGGYIQRHTEAHRKERSIQPEGHT